ncbi:MAG: T9SS type A sorting domain-containing protein [Chitinophagaceae bacterium]|nr:MAG: T9SS type A sorting domain-containing protein [Chitinophagaceae bacterium]
MGLKFAPPTSDRTPPISGAKPKPLWTSCGPTATYLRILKRTKTKTDMTKSSLSGTGTAPVTHTSTRTPKGALRKLWLLAASALAFGVAGAQSTQTIFSENMGGTAVGGTTALNSYTGWQNTGLTFTASGTADLRSNQASNISGASGGNNVFINTTVGSTFSISNINTSNFSGIALTFNLYKNVAAATPADLVVEYSTDGTNFTSPNGGSLTYGTASGAVWTAKTATGTIPSASNLTIRFRQISTTIQYRIDDVKLTGVPASPTLTDFTPTSVPVGSPATIIVNGTNFIKGSANSSNLPSATASSVVTFNGSSTNVTTTWISSTQLSASIAASLLSSGGTASIRVSTNGAAATSAAQTLTISTEPTAVTGTASLTNGSNSVTLNGTVNPATASTTVTFNYGLTNAYGTSVPASQSPVTGNSATAVSTPINGLDPNVTYHFNVTASNGGGSATGSDATFVSPAVEPEFSPTVNNATVTTLDVSLSGDSNPGYTEYAIIQTGSGLYVQSNGALGASPFFQTISSWGTKTVTGLSGGTSYTFASIARNSSGTTTANGPSASASTVNGNSIAINGASFAASYCNGTAHTFNVSFTPGGTFNGDFKVQMSDASGVFPGNTTSNIIGSGPASPVSVTIPMGAAAGIGYRFRVVNDDPSFTGTDNGSDVTIVAAVTPSVSISANPGSTICAGTSVTFTATPVNGGTATYAWTRNGSPVGTNSNTYTNAALAEGDVIAVTMTSSISCVSTSTATDQVTMTVNTTAAPAVPTTSGGCGSTTLNAYTDPGAPLAYYWQGTNSAGTATDLPATDPYVATAGGTYYVRAYNSSTGCWSASSSAAVTVVANVVIGTQPVSATVYAGNFINFTASATNSASVKWQESTDGGSNWSDVSNGGAYSGATANTLYVTAAPSMNGYKYRAIYTGNAPCATTPTNAASLSVLPALATVFSESMGTVGGNTPISGYTGWQNNGVLTFSTANGPTDLRNTNPSSTYPGASGSANVFFTTTSTTARDFIISGINTTGYSNLTLSFGIKTDAAGAPLVLEYSTDAISWNALSFTTPTASGWNYVTASGTIPSVSNLRLRWTKPISQSSSYRIDDVKLQGYRPDPATTSISPASGYAGDATFTLTVNGSNFVNGASIVTWNGTPLTTTYVSSSVLTASVSASRVASAGTATVGVTTTGAANASNTQTFTINPRSITFNSISGNSFCNGSANALTVNFTPVGSFSGSFYVQLSDASGNFPANTTDNIISSPSNSSPIVASIPQGTVAGTYKVRVLNSNPQVYSGASNNITIDQSGSATLSYAGSPYCTSTGTAAVFFSGTNGGTFSAAPAGLVIDANTGDIDIAASASGNYTVTYSFAGGTACASSASTMVSIRPAELIATVGNPVYCAGSATAPINFTVAPGINTSWANTNTAIGLAASGTGNIPSFVATNAGATAQYASISVLPQGGTGCSAKIMAFRIAVSPAPTVNTVSNQVVCAGSATAPVTFSGALAGTVYSWTNNNSNIGLNATGTGNLPSFTARTNAGQQTATITVTPQAGGCAGDATTFTISVSAAAGSIAYAGSPYCQVGPATVTHLGSAGGTYTSTAGLALDASSGTVNLAASTPGTYTVTYTVAASGGCAATATASITIKPQATVNPIGNQEYCDGVVTAPIAFTGTAPSYNWSNDNTAIGLGASSNGTNLPSFTTQNAGPGTQYAYITVVPQGNGSSTCTASKGMKFRIRVNFCPPITQVGDTNGGDATARTASTMTLSPNPARGQVTVQYSGREAGPFTLQVLNSQGLPATRLQSFSGNTANVDLSALRPGVYMLQLVNTRSGATVQKQLIKL